MAEAVRRSEYFRDVPIVKNRQAALTWILVARHLPIDRNVAKMIAKMVSGH